MRVAKVKTQPRKTDSFNVSNLILTYGENNDYPERINDIVRASPTGKGCLDIDVRFTFGNGFIDKALASFIINTKNRNANQELKIIAKDFKEFGGFYFHVNYNGMFEPVEIQHIPFEHCRIAINQEKEISNFIAVHPNWTSRAGLKPFKKNDIKYYPIYNPLPEVILAQLNGRSMDEYEGQVFFYSNEGVLTYPLSPFDSVVTDMSTEEAVSTVLHRNAKHNFLPAGILTRKRKQQSTTAGNEEKELPTDGLASEVTQWQGDERAAKIIVVDIEFDEEAPTFVPFPIQNFDRMFDNTAKYIEDKIAKVFMQPPLLRGVDAGAGFGADLMKNSYDFYNSIIEPDRKVIEEILKGVLQRMPVKFTNYEIAPLTYISQPNEQTTK